METIIKNGRVLVTDIYVETLDGTLEDVISQYKKWSEQCGVPVQDIYYRMYDYNEYAYIEYWRDETEEEKKARAEAARKKRERNKKKKEAKEAWEKKEFDRLMKKYGKPS